MLSHKRKVLVLNLQVVWGPAVGALVTSDSKWGVGVNGCLRLCVKPITHS